MTRRLNILLILLFLTAFVCVQTPGLAGRSRSIVSAERQYAQIARDARTRANSETFAQAVARLGSTKAVLLIEGSQNVDAAVTVPATLKLKWATGARLVKAAGGSLHFRANPFVDGQEMGTEALFSGFAASEIVFASTAGPIEVSTEVADHEVNSVTERLKLLTVWFSATQVKFHALPRPITSAAVLNDNHSIYFRKGEFPNTYPHGGNLGQAAFTLGSNSSFSSEEGAIIYESSAGPSPKLVATKNNCRSCIIERNHFKSARGAAGDGASPNVLITGGCQNCHIRHNWFDGISGYHAGITQGNGQNPPEGCSIDNNTFTGFLTQLAFINGGRKVSISNNKFLLRNQKAHSYFTLIDVEPNIKSEIVEDLVIAGNEIDLRGVEQYNMAIYVQGVNTAGAKRVKISGNRILGDDNQRIQYGIRAEGVTGLEIFDNITHGVGVPVMVDQSQNFAVHNNDEQSSRDGNYWIIASGKGNLWNNTMRYPNATVNEGERRHPASSAGTSELTLIHDSGEASDGRIYDSYAGMTIRYNAADWKVTSVDVKGAHQKLTVSGKLPILNSRNFTPAAINSSTGVIHIPSHGFANGAAVQWWTDGTTPGGIKNNQTVYLIAVDANNVMLSDTEATGATGPNPIIPSSQGSGSHYILPVFLTKFSSNKYRNNRIRIYKLLGTSVTDGEL